MEAAGLDRAAARAACLATTLDPPGLLAGAETMTPRRREDLLALAYEICQSPWDYS